MYEPKPIDTQHVALPAGIRDLVERLAENSHDLWAQPRMRDGWTYNPRRDDERKRHPDLVPYAELPESEKELRPPDRARRHQGDPSVGISDREAVTLLDRRGFVSPSLAHPCPLSGVPQWCRTPSDDWA
jgi:ryanodine receptor 2